MCGILLEGALHPSRRGALGPRARVHSTSCRLNVLAAGHAPRLGMNHTAAVLTPDLTAPAHTQRNLVPSGLARFESGPLPKQPQVEQLSGRVICVLGFNESSFTLNGTNIFIVGTGRRRVLIDAGEASPKAEMVCALLRDVFAQHGIEGLDEIIVTHLHHDHFGGVELICKLFGPCRVSKLPSPQYEIDRRRDVVREAQEFEGLGANQVPKSAALTWLGLEFELHSGYHRLQEREVIRTEGATLRIHSTPGHAPDHAVIELLEEHALFSGDHVLGWGTSWVDDLSLYVSSLHKIDSIEGLARIYPGHGPVIVNAREHLHRYLEHRQQREAQVWQALVALAPLTRGAPTTSRVVTRAIYRDSTDLERAEGNVLKILAKLKVDGRVLSLDPPEKLSTLDEADDERARKETGSDGRSDPSVPTAEFEKKWLAIDLVRGRM
jgi:ribonuclease/clavin/mitogillin